MANFSENSKPQTMPLPWLPPSIRKFLKRVTPDSWRLFARTQALSDEKRRLQRLQESFDRLCKGFLEQNNQILRTEVASIVGISVNDISLEIVEYLKILAEAVTAINDRAIVASDVRNRLLNCIVSLDSESLSLIAWLNLSYIAFRNKLIAESYYYREQAIARAYCVGSESSDLVEVRQAITATVDQYDKEKAKTYLRRYEQLGGNGDRLLKLRSYADMVFGNTAERIIDNASDETYRALLQERSIAIVGPAASEEFSGEEIDAFDIVIRPNYLGQRKMPDPAIFGSKVDISFYNAEHSERLHLNGETEFFAELKYAAFPYNIYPFQERLFRHGRARLFEKNTFFFNGVPNMIQNILYDILPYAPARIKVFHTNFYFDKKLYHSTYTSRHEFLLPTLAEHDLLSQLHFVKNLWRSKVIEVDMSCVAVLEMSDKLYMEGIDKLHMSKD